MSRQQDIDATKKRKRIYAAVKNGSILTQSQKRSLFQLGQQETCQRWNQHVLTKCLGRGSSSASCRTIRFFIDATEDVYEVNVRLVFDTVGDVLETLKLNITLLGCLSTDRSNYNHLLHVVGVKEDPAVYLTQLYPDINKPNGYHIINLITQETNHNPKKESSPPLKKICIEKRESL